MTETLIQINPFPGLRAFDTKESDLFYGRDKQVSELLAKLRTTCFLAVVGTSGSGKTSLVQGGLIPRLKEGFTAISGDEWRIAKFNPSNDPIGNMSIALSQENVLNNQGKVEPNYASFVENELRSSSLGLANVYKKSAIKNKANLLLVIDQFEEIFRFNEDEKRSGIGTNDSLTFVNLLLFANRQKDLPIYIVMTMHTDFLGNASEFRGLPEVINEGQFLIPRMKRQEIRKAITAPLASVETLIAPTLLNLLLDELPEGQDELPILQHCLMRMWGLWKEKGNESLPIDLEIYREVGTLDCALSNHAEEAYNNLSSDKDREICEQLFKILITTRKDGQATRRAVTVDEIIKLTGASDQKIMHLIDVFGRSDRAFLDAPPINLIEPHNQINISNECLMRAWDRLGEWIEEETQSVEIYRRLSIAAHLQYTGKAGYWRNPELAIGINWFQRARPTKLWASRYNDSFDQAIDFLRKSKQEHEAKLAFEEAERQDKLRRAKRVARGAMFAGVVGLGLAIFAGYTAMLAKEKERIAQKERTNAIIAQNLANEEKIKADKERKEAEAQREIANVKTKEAIMSEKVAAKATIVAKTEAEKAAQEAIRAEKEAKEAERQAKIAAEQARLAAISEEEARKQQEKAEEARLKAEEAKKEAVLAQARAERLRILGQAQTIITSSISTDDKTVKGLLAKEAYEINKNYEGEVNDHRIYAGLHKSAEALYGKNYNNLNVGHQANAAIYGVAPSGSHLFTSGLDGRLMLCNIDSPDRAPFQVNDSRASDYRTMALSKNGGLLVCGGEMPVWEIYDLKHGKEKIVIEGHRNGTNEIVVHPNEKGFYAAGKDGSILFCDLNTVNSFAQSANPVNTITINKTGGLLAMADNSGNITIYNTTDSSSVYKSVQVGRKIKSLQFNPASSKLAIGTVGGNLLLWNLKSGNISIHQGHDATIVAIGFNTNGSRLFTASRDNTVRVWESAKISLQAYFPIVLPHDNWVLSATFKKTNGRDQIITGTNKGAVKIWDIDTDILAKKICHKLERQLSDEEWEKYIQLKEDERPKGITCEAFPLSNK